MKKTMILDTRLYQLGVWTPKARILCLSCHGPVFPDRVFSQEDFELLKIPIGLQPGNWNTQCDQCLKRIQVEKAIAYEHNMVRELRKRNINAFMAQTGSMYHAVHIPKRTMNENEPGNDYKLKYVLLYDFEGEEKYHLQDEYGEIYSTPDAIAMFRYCLKIKNLMEEINDDES